MEQAKVNEVKGKLRVAIDAFFDTIASEDIRNLFKEFSFVAGGAIASLASDDKPNDLDIYFKNSEASLKAARYFLEKMDISLPDEHIIKRENGLSLRVPGGIIRVPKDEEPKYQPLILTANAISFTDGIQLVLRFAGNPDTIAENFDFLHTQGTYDYKEDALLVPEAVELAIEQKRITYTGSEYPLASLIRTRKFMRRGWNINAGQFLKMSIQVSKLDLANPIVLKEQLVGVDLLYFEAFLKSLAEKDEGELNEMTVEKRFQFLFDKIDEAFKKNEKEDTKDESADL